MTEGRSSKFGSGLGRVEIESSIIGSSFGENVKAAVMLVNTAA